MKTNSNNTGIVCVHPLTNRSITDDLSLEAWYKRWYASSDKRELISLLHIGFDFGTLKAPGTGITGRDQKNLFLFYLSVANGWREDILVNDSDTPSYNPRCMIRKEIAKKAFDMLCQNPFNEWITEVHSRKYLDNRYLSQLILPVLVNFFGREDNEGKFRLCNLPLSFSEKSHHDRTAEKFLLRLIEQIWNWENRWIDKMKPHQVVEANSEESQETKKRLRSFRPWTIEVLYRMSRLDMLSSVKILGEEVEAKLLEIALQSPIRSESDQKLRKAYNLDEALRVGNNAAWFLHKHRTMMRSS